MKQTFKTKALLTNGFRGLFWTALEIVSAANNVAELVTRVVPTFYSAF